MITKGMMSSNSNEWATPWRLYEELDKEFHFTLDPCATDATAKAPEYFTKDEDGLAQSWAGDTVFCNPPYGREIPQWVKKCHDEWKEHNITIVMLIPSRTDTSYFHDYIYGNAELRFLRGRVKFIDEQGVEGAAAPFPSMVVVFRKR